VLLEPVQGEGGVYPCDAEYLAQVRALCDEHEALLIFDEVQTGFFRTGPAFGWQGYGVKPDVMALAKSLANGLPAGAVMAHGSAAEAFSPGDHGSTFGGGPVIAAAALATIGALEAERLGENAARIGAHLASQLRELASATEAITEVRDRGLMIAAELAAPHAQRVAETCLERGIVLNAIGDHTLRLLPPLVCSEQETAIMIDTLSAVIGAA
jgi:acetylornithine/succinyldiaminopimelate/putrescine aminotransferase